MRPTLLPTDPRSPFPSPERALHWPNGLLAMGGCLSPERLQNAYRAGIFPWYSEGEPILWWSPDPRCVLFPENIRIHRSLRKTLRKGLFQCTADTAFAAVIDACAAQRAETGTWISPEMRAAYGQLHVLGMAHSVETWHAGALVGGLYGVAIGRMFYGESMFSVMPDASKVALVALCARLQRWHFPLIDCQMHTPHLESMGAVLMPRADFLTQLHAAVVRPADTGHWTLDADLMV